jgi:NAD-dependent SIR2 family protein deacetylase
MKKVICEKCKKEMKNFRNISGLVYLSNPPQWDNVYVCDNCKTKKTIREYGEPIIDYSYLEEYEEIK